MVCQGLLGGVRAREYRRDYVTGWIQHSAHGKVLLMLLCKRFLQNLKLCIKSNSRNSFWGIEHLKPPEAIWIHTVWPLHKGSAPNMEKLCHHCRKVFHCKALKELRNMGREEVAPSSASQESRTCGLPAKLVSHSSGGCRSPCPHHS